MIVVELFGGLGNQMFQYALGRHLACINQTELKINFQHHIGGTLRHYELHCFNINTKFVSKKELKKFNFIDQLKLPYKIKMIAQKMYGFHIINEPYFHFSEEVLRSPKKSLLKGYWQSEKYFKSIEQIILQDFQVRQPLAGENLATALKINNCTAVSIHIRRGDYVSDSKTNKFHGTCSLDYYQRGVELITARVTNPHFFIFSDDPVWVQANLKLDHPACYVNHNPPDKGFEDMRLMGLCRHHIIANSSFSWWGAWLGKYNGKIVIAPHKWFNVDSKDTGDLLPEAWLRI